MFRIEQINPLSSRVESIELRLTDLYKKLVSLPSTEQIETELALLNESIEKFTHIDINKLDQVKTDILLFDELVNKLTEKVDSLNITNIEESLNHHKHTSKQQMKDIDNSLIELTGSTQQNKLDLTGLKVDLTELKGSTQQTKVDLTELKGSIQQNKVDLTELKGSTQQTKVDLTELKGSTEQTKVDLTELKGSIQQNKVDLTELKGSIQQNKVDLTELKGSIQQNKVDLTELKGSIQQTKVDLTELKGSTQQTKVDLTELKGSTQQNKVDLTELKGSTQQNKVDLTELKGSTQQNKVDLTELKGSTQQTKVDLTELKGSTQQTKVDLTELKGSTQQTKVDLTELKGLVNKHNLDLQACVENVTALKQKVGERETMYPRLNEVEGGVKDVKAKLVLVESSITNLTSLSTRLDQHQLILNTLNDKPNKTTFETQTKIDISQVKATIVRESNALKTNITNLANTISKKYVDVNVFNSKTKQLTISINDLDSALKQITSKIPNITTDIDQIKAKTLILDTLKTTTDNLQQRFTELHDLTSHLAEKDKERTEETNVWVPLMTQQSTELQKLRENLNVTTTSVSDNLKKLAELHNKFTLFESKTERGLETCSESVGELEKSVNKIEGVLRGIPSFFSLNSKAMFFAELKKSLFFSPGIVLPKTVEIKSLYITTNIVPKQTRLFELLVVADGATTVLDSFEKPSTDEVIMQDYLYSLQVDAKSKILISCDKKITAMAVLTMQYI